MYSAVDLSKPYSTLNIPLFCLRRLLIAGVVVFVPSFSLQINALITMSTLQLCFLLDRKPFEDKLVQQLEDANEAAHNLLLITIIPLSAYTLDPATRHFIGYSAIGVLGVQLLVSYCILAKSSLSGLILECKRKRARRRWNIYYSKKRKQ